MNPQIKSNLQITVNTLNNVAVKGEANLNALLASIQMLRQTIQLCDQPEITIEPDEPGKE